MKMESNENKIVGYECDDFGNDWSFGLNVVIKRVTFKWHRKETRRIQTVEI